MKLKYTRAKGMMTKEDMDNFIIQSVKKQFPNDSIAKIDYVDFGVMIELASGEVI